LSSIASLLDSTRPIGRRKAGTLQGDARVASASCVSLEVVAIVAHAAAILALPKRTEKKEGFAVNSKDERSRAGGRFAG
jgi:hypothetical protein